MTFRDLHRQLASNLRARVRGGKITESGLARLTGVSQPHIHNVLKGKKVLSPKMADQIMSHLRMHVLDLIEPSELLRWQQHDERKPRP